MDGMPATTRLGISGSVLQAEQIVSSEYSQFVVQEKPPPSYEESQQQQQQVAFRSETNEVSQTDKVAIYRHPLFPLLAMLFDKCEQATNSNEGPSSHAFQNDIRSFLLHLGQDGKVLITGNEEIDSLVSNEIFNRKKAVFILNFWALFHISPKASSRALTLILLLVILIHL